MRHRQTVLALAILIGSVCGGRGVPAQDSVRRSYNDGGYKALGEAKYDTAERLFRAAIKDADDSGKRDTTLASSLLGLGRVYRAKADYAAAEPLFKQALGIVEQTEGANSSWVASALHYLAGLYEDQGKYAEAEPLYKRSLAIEEKVLGAEHPSVAITLNSLARSPSGKTPGR